MLNDSLNLFNKWIVTGFTNYSKHSTMGALHAVKCTSGKAQM